MKKYNLYYRISQSVKTETFNTNLNKSEDGDALTAEEMDDAATEKTVRRREQLKHVKINVLSYRDMIVIWLPYRSNL